MCSVIRTRQQQQHNRHNGPEAAACLHDRTAGSGSELVSAQTPGEKQLYFTQNSNRDKNARS